MTFIDLSHKITPTLPVYPQDSPLSLFQEKTLDKDGFNAFRLETGLHVGTHIDAPSHLTESRLSIGHYPLQKFIGPGVLFDIRGKGLVTPKDFKGKPIPPDSIVLLLTDGASLWGKDGYFSYAPPIQEEVADFLISKKIKLLGLDAFSPDKHPFPLHHKLFQKDILLIENLTNLSALLTLDSFTIQAIPLRLEAEASLARVFAQY